MRNKKFLLNFLGLATISIFLSSASFAASAAHEKAAENLLDAINMDKLLNQSIEAMLQLEIQKNPQLALYQNSMREFFSKYMSGESLRGDFVELYTEAFTEKELEEITAFYQTETGQKVLERTPTLMAQGSSIGEKRVQDNIGELQEMILEETKQLQALQYAVRQAAAEKSGEQSEE